MCIDRLLKRNGKTKIEANLAKLLIGGNLKAARAEQNLLLPDSGFHHKCLMCNHLGCRNHIPAENTLVIVDVSIICDLNLKFGRSPSASELLNRSGRVKKKKKKKKPGTEFESCFIYLSTT